MTLAAPFPVLVTGATKRLGFEIARALGVLGYPLIIHARRDDHSSLDALDKLQALGFQAELVACDLADPDSITKMIAQVTHRHDRLAGLINNAGLFEADNLESFTPESFLKHQAVNVQAPILLIQGLQQQLAAAKGCVVNILDHNIENPNIDFLSYKLSRFAMAGGIRILARALAPDIRVNGIAPGLTLPSPLQTLDEFGAIHGKVPLGRGSDPQDIANAICYFMTALAVTGQIMFVDGGERFLARLRDVSIIPPT